MLIEMMREHQRAINQTMREVDRERTGLQYQEKKIIMDVKKAAKGGQMVRNNVKKNRHSEYNI